METLPTRIDPDPPPPWGRAHPTAASLDASPPVADDMVVSASVRGDRALVTITGEVDRFNAHRLDDALQTLGRHGIRHFLIDLDAVRFFDSGGVGAIAHLLGEYPRSRVRVTGAGRLTEHLLDLAGLSGVLSL